MKSSTRTPLLPPKKIVEVVAARAVSEQGRDDVNLEVETSVGIFPMIELRVVRDPVEQARSDYDTQNRQLPTVDRTGVGGPQLNVKFPVLGRVGPVSSKDFPILLRTPVRKELLGPLVDELMSSEGLHVSFELGDLVHSLMLGTTRSESSDAKE